MRDNSSESFGITHEIDPGAVTLGDKPKRRRKPKTRKTIPMPEHLKPWAEAAARRMGKRPASPGIMLEPTPSGDGVTLTAPYDEDDAWLQMIGDAFGTRSWGVMKTFLVHLKDLCGERYREDLGAWVPSERELNAALAILHSARPRDELEAMQVAQAVAIHWMQMAVSHNILRNGSSYVDPRTAATVSMLSRTFTLQLESIRAGRKRSRTKSKQVIEVHHHQHQHVHLEGASDEFGGQAHAQGAETLIATLSGQDEGGRVVLLAGSKGQEAMPDARRRERVGGSKG